MVSSRFTGLSQAVLRYYAKIHHYATRQTPKRYRIPFGPIIVHQLILDIQHKNLDKTSLRPYLPQQPEW